MVRAHAMLLMRRCSRQRLLRLHDQGGRARSCKTQIDDVRNAVDQERAARGRAGQADGRAAQAAASRSSTRRPRSSRATRPTSGCTVQKLQTDLAQLTGRIDDLQHAAGRAHQAVPGLSRGLGHQARAAHQQHDRGQDAAHARDRRRAVRRGRQAAGGAAVGRRAPAVRGVRQSLPDGRARGARRSSTSARRTRARSATPTPSAPTPRSSTTFPKSDVVPDAMYKNGHRLLRAQVLQRRARSTSRSCSSAIPRPAGRKTRTRSSRSSREDQKNKAVCSS